MNRRLATFSLAGLLALTTACSAPTPSTSPTSASATKPDVPAKTSPPAEPVDEAVQPGADIGVPGLVALRRVTTDNGSYIQSTLAPGNPLLGYDPKRVQNKVKDAYSQAEILDAQRFLVTFIAEEGLDSSLGDNMTPQTRQTWYDANRSKFIADAPWLDPLVLESDNAGALVNAYAQFQRPGYSLAHDGGPRVAAESINLIQLYGDENVPGITMQAETTISRRTDATNAKPLEEFKSTNLYSAVQEDGQWKISKWQNLWTTTKVGNRDEPEDLSKSAEGS